MQELHNKNHAPYQLSLDLLPIFNTYPLSIVNYRTIETAIVTYQSRGETIASLQPAISAIRDRTEGLAAHRNSGGGVDGLSAWIGAEVEENIFQPIFSKQSL